MVMVMGARENTQKGVKEGLWGDWDFGLRD